MSKRGPIFGSKEDIAFREALKLYDSKQYKKSLKLVDQNLKKNANHAESLALKGCITYFIGNKTEAENYVRKGCDKAPSNHLVCHLAGIFYRNMEKYNDAAKWYKAAIVNGSSNKQIYRDLSIMQVQIRDYEGFKVSRQAYLEDQPGFRANWTGNAVAQHLNKDYNAAISTLSKIEDLVKEHLNDSDKMEHSECLLYKHSIMIEAGQIGKALEALDKDESDIRDKASHLEYKAHCLQLLGRNKEASLIYRQLLQRNPDNKNYYLLLDESLGTNKKDLEIRLGLYDKLVKFYPRSDPPVFLPLTFLPGNHPEFAIRASKYVLSQLKRGTPATFINIKPLYKDQTKLEVISNIVLEFFNKDIKDFNPTVYVWTLYFLAQHYLYLNDLDAAKNYIEKAIDHSPTLVELYIIKARIWKHMGLYEEAAEIMNEGRELDLQDRFINSKTTKYYFRANQVDKAIDTISLFTKLEDGAVNGCKDLHLMQVNWVLLESAEAYSRLYHELETKLAQLKTQKTPDQQTEEEEEENCKIETELVENIELYRGLALKRFNAIIKIFDIFYNDQLDFHSYCLRRGTPRDYIKTLRWESKIHSTPIYSRVMKGLSQIYFELYEKQIAAKSQELEDADSGDKAKKNKDKKKNKKAKSQELKKKEKLVAKVASEKDDSDPFGATLISSLLANSNGKILDNLKSLMKPVVEEAPDYINTWEIEFEISIREKKYVLALAALKHIKAIMKLQSGKKNDKIANYISRLLNSIESDNTVVPAVAEVVKKGIKSAFPEY